MRTDRFSSLLKKLPSPEKRLFWFIVVFVLKFSLLILMVGQHRPTLMPDTIAICYGDCDGYLLPVDNLLQTGFYSPDYRMPGYGFPYFIIRIFFDQKLAVNLLIILQTLLDVFAALVLAITLLKLTNKKIAFYLTILLYGVGVTVSCYNNWILTESFTSSAMIIGFYFLVKHFRKSRPWMLFFSGAFFTWAYFLRPANAGLLVILLLFILISSKRHHIRYCIIFLLPAILFNSIWTYRNYVVKNKIFALTEYAYSKDLFHEFGFATVDFCKTFSDFKVTVNFFEKGGLTYFGQSVPILSEKDIVIPDDIYTQDFNRDSLLLVRNYFDELASTGLNETRKLELESLITKKMTLYKESVVKNHPFIVYVRTPLQLTLKFIKQTGVHTLYHFPFSHLTTIQKGIKLFFIFLYWIAFTFFLLGILIYHKRILHNKMILAGYFIAFYIIFIHSIVLRSIEPRYIISAYPFFVIGAVFTLSSLSDFLSSKQNN